MTNGVVSARGGRLQKLVMENRKFTNTAIPVFSGTEGWYQHIHIVQAIVKSNGWPEETAALQLFVHLKGEALNVALLLAKKERESWTGLVEGLAAYYQSPGRLAGLRRRFKSAFHQAGIGSSYIRNRSRNVGDPRVWRYEGASARYDDKG